MATQRYNQRPHTDRALVAAQVTPAVVTVQGLDLDRSSMLSVYQTIGHP
jgi:hypothetical protein